MTVHPCTFPQVLGYAQKQRKEPNADPETCAPGDWNDEEIAEFGAINFEPCNISACPLPTNQQ